MAVTEVVVCMGSACFCRGNARNLSAIQEQLRSRGLEHEVNVTGTLCQNRCRQGPNLIIDEVFVSGVEPETLPDLLDEHLGKPRRVRHEQPQTRLH